MAAGVYLVVAVLGAAFAFTLTGGELGRLPLARARRRLRIAVTGLGQSIGRTRVVSRLLGDEAWSWLARRVGERVREAGLDWDLETACGAVLAAIGLSGVLVAAAFASPVAGAMASAAEVVAVRVCHADWARRRRAEALREMPGIYRTLSVAMGSGETLTQAVAYVGAHARGPAAEAFSRTALRLRCGETTDEALERLSGELDVPGTGLLVTALAISHRTGSPMRDLLMRSARLVERQEEFERLLAVKTAQVRLSVRIVCTLPALMVGLLSAISPDFRAGLLTPVGMGCLVLAVVLDALALAIIRHLVRGVL